MPPLTAKTCFVISPIGDEGTPVRQEADAILWIIRRALEKYDFAVVRVDEIARSAVITNEIVQLIQESALAIIVLTGHNPNVFYEAGRRHETGKPFIQMIKRGEALPFDVAGIKTIIYDSIESLAGVARTIDDIQKYVEEFEKSGYGTAGAGVSLSTIAFALDRIERKLSQSPGVSSAAASAGRSGAFDPLGFMANPRQAFMGAVATGNLARAAELLPRLEAVLGPSQELVAAAGFLATAGNEYAADLILRIVEASDGQILQEPSDDDEASLNFAKTVLSSLVRFFGMRDREAEGLVRLDLLVQRLLGRPGLGGEDKAYIINQLQILCYGAGEYERAIDLCEQVMELDPTEVAYVFNASLVYEKMGLLQKSLAMVDRYMASGTDSASHLSHAVEMYVATNNTQKAKVAFEQLRETDNERAAVLLMDRKVKNVLGL